MSTQFSTFNTQKRSVSQTETRSARVRHNFKRFCYKLVSVEGKPTLNYSVLLITSIALIAVGWLMVFSGSAVYSIINWEGDTYKVIRRQTAALLLGFMAMQIGMRLPYRAFAKLSGLVFVVALVANVAFIFTGNELANGAERWISIAGLRFQPSEVAKFAILVGNANLLSKFSKSVGNELKVTLPVIAVTLALAIPVLKQPDLGSATVIVLISAIMLFLAGTSLWMLMSLAIVAAGGFMWAVRDAAYRGGRIAAWRDPWAYAEGDGYQILQAWVGLNSGGLGGVGIGQSVAKWGFLPEAHTDFIFAVLAEEAGLIGAAMVLAAFCVIMIFGIRSALQAQDRFGSILAGGITGWFVFQALINMGIVAGVFPISGLTLPFISYGGTSLLVSMGTLGILLNIARNPAENQGGSTRSRRRQRPAEPTTIAARANFGRNRRRR